MEKINELIREAVNTQCPEKHNALISIPEIQDYLETVVEYCGDCGVMVYIGDLTYSEYQRDRVCDQCWDDSDEMDM